MTTRPGRWAIVVPVKRLDVAKTRLSDDPQVRADLALSMAEDTVRAVVACAAVAAVVVVTDEPGAASAMTGLGAIVVADAPDAGLNPALEHGARECARLLPDGSVAAIASDLPALRASSLDRLLERAAAHPSAVVADAGGTGSTVLTARTATVFAPRFGPESLRAHIGAGAVDLTDRTDDDIRRDVDTEDDLRDAFLMGCGPSTTAAARRHRLLG